jgi:UDP-N-acetylglucosamine transferase subunit ALG13
MPRSADLGENNDDHQREIVAALAERGLIEVAEEASALQGALERALAKAAQRATTAHAALIDRLGSLVQVWFGGQ